MGLFKLISNHTFTWGAIMQKPYWNVSWLDEIGFLAFFTMVLFIAGLIIGQLVEVPHFLLGPNRPTAHLAWDLIAACSFLFVIYHGWMFGWTVHGEMTDFSGKFVGASLMVGAAIPLGFMLTYQFRMPGNGGSREMLLNLFSMDHY
jgi:hypothetical protein